MGQFKRFAMYAIPLVVLLTVVLLWVLRGKEASQAVSDIRLPVRIISPQKGDMERTLELSGRIESENQVTILPRIPGRLESLLVEVGDRVAAGDVLGKIDPEQYQLSLTQAKAGYSAAESSFKRIERLYSAGATSAENHSSAQAQYQSLKSQYELALLQYNYTSIQTPVSGSVLIKHLNTGSLVSPSIPVYTIGSLDSLKASIQIPEEYYSFFTEETGQIPVVVRHASLETVITDAEIISVAPFVSPQSRNFEIIVRLGYPQNFRPGMLVYVTFVLEKRDDVYYLPQGLTGAQAMYWHVDSAGEAQSLENPGLFETDDYVQIPDEWKDYQMVAQGQYFLSSGQAVEILGEARE